MNNDAIRQFVRKELRAVTLGVATAIGIGGGLPAAIAGTAGGTIVGGRGSISTPNATTTLIDQQSGRLTINWSSFNIAGNETVRFVQPSSSSVALNNILSQSPSQIFGRIDANGRVVLINPNGILFGRTAQLNVGSLIASSLELKAYDPTTGRLTFQSLSGHPGAIVNEGTITAAHGGSVALLGGTVLNNGLVVADYGSVAMGAGKMATLDFYGGGLLRLAVSGDVKTNPTGASAAVANNGRIQADGGQVLLTAAATKDVFASAVNNTGVVRASRISNVGGVIELSGPDGVVSNSGTLDANGQGDGSTGGTVKFTGQDVGLFAGSTINASGPAGGGTVLVGGGAHGANPDVQDASHTYIDAGTTIDADATKSGDGGNVVVWSNDGTRYYGSISARGAGQGSGGSAEVSGEAYLDYEGQTDLRGAPGKTGTLLLDPAEITIDHDANGANTKISTSGSGPYTDTSSGAGSILSDGTINFELYNANVTITTYTNGITIDDGVALKPMDSTGDVESPNSNTLTLNSNGDISWAGNWSYSNSGQLTLSAANGVVGPSAAGTTVTVGGTSPVLIRGANGIGTTSPLATTGLTTVAAAAVNTGDGIYISNSGSNVTVSSLTNTFTGSVTGLETGSNGAISLVNSGGSITLSQPVTAGGNAGVTLEGVGVTQSSASTVNAGSGDILVDGGGDAIDMKGALTTTSTTATAAMLKDASTITLPAITTGSTGTTTIGATGGVVSGAVIQSASTVITTGTLTGDTTDSVTLGNANKISNLGAFTSDGFTLDNAGALTLAGAVDGGTGSVSLQATGTGATLKLAGENVSGAGVTLEGVGVTQSSGSTVDAGSGDILVDGGAGVINMAGALTTTSVAATAAMIKDASTVTLPAITTGSTGTTTIGATGGVISGAVTQSGSTIITTGTLTGGGTNSVNLGNDNKISNLGAFTSVGLTLDNAGALTLTGAVDGGTGLVMLQATGTNATLALGGKNVSGAGVTLEGVGVTQSSGSTVDAGSGDILVDGGGGAIAMEGALTTTSAAASAATLKDATTVALPAITTGLTGTTGTTTIGVTGDIPGAVTQSGSTIISTGTLTGDTAGSVDLGNGNKISNLGSFTSDGFTLNNAGALSLTGAVDGGTGSVTLQATGTGATLALGGENVSGAGVTLEGKGVTQSTGSKINAGSGDILIDGEAGVINMAGALTTTSVAATAAMIKDASTVTLPAITTGSTGTTTIGATGGVISGVVTQSGSTVITTGTLTGDGTDSVTLANANKVSNLGAFTSVGFTLDNTGALTLTGAVDGGAGSVSLQTTGTSATLKLAGENVSGAGVTLEGVGVTQSSGSAVDAGSGDILVDGGGGAIDMEGALTTTSATATAATLKDATTVALPAITTGPTGTTGTTTIGVTGDVSGAVTQSGTTIISTGTLTGDTAGSVDLGNDNKISNLGAFTSVGFTLDNAGALSLTGAVDGGTGAVTLQATGTGATLALGGENVSGAGVTLEGVGVTQSSGSTVDAGSGDILVDGGGGAIDMEGALTTTSATATAATLKDATTVTLPAVTTGPTGTTGTTTIGVAGDISGAVIQSGTTIISTGTLTGDAAASVDLSNGNAISNLGTFTSDGFTLDNAGALSLSGAVDGGTGSVTLEATGTGATLALGSENVSGTGVTLEGVGVTQSSGSAVDAGSGDILVDGGGGAIDMEGALTTTSATATAAMLKDATTVALPAITTGPTGTTGTTTIGVTGDVSGAVTQSGTTIISTGTLTGDTAGSVNLGNNVNAIPILGAFSAVGFALKDGDALSITGELDGNGGAVSLVSSGTISEGGGGFVTTTGTLQTSSDGGTTLGGANLIGGFSATNTTSGGVILTNAAALTITNLNQSGGGQVSVTNSGTPITLSGTNSADGALSLTSTSAGVTLGSTDSDNLTVGGVLSVTSDGSIIEQGGSSVTAPSAAFTLNSPTGDLILKNAASLGTITLTGTGHNLDLESTDQTQIDALLTGKTWAAVTVSDNSAAISLPNFTATGALSVTAPGISQSAGPIVAGATTLNAGGNPISLDETDNSFSGDVAFIGSSVTLASGGALTSSGTASGNLSESAGGTISEGTAGIQLSGTVADTATFTVMGSGPTDVDLGNASNSFNGEAITITASGGALGNVRIADTGTTFVPLTLSSSTLTSLVLSDTHAPIVIPAATLTGVGSGENLAGGSTTLDVTAGGAITQSGAVSVTGTTALNVSSGTADITLGGANTFTGNVAFSGDDVTLTTGTGGLSSSGTADGDLSETAAGAISEGAGGIQLTGTAGADTATFTVTGATYDVDLGNAANDFNDDPTTIGVSAGGTVGDVRVVDTNATFAPLTFPGTVTSLVLSDAHAPITIPVVTLTGVGTGENLAGGPTTLDVTSGGAITEAGVLVVNGATALNASSGSGDITLSDASNAFKGDITPSGSNVTVANAVDTTLAGATTATNLTLDAGGAVIFGAASRDNTSVTNGLIVQGVNGSGAAGGAVSQTGALSVGGTMSIDAGANGITLSNPGNVFSGPVTLTGGAVALANTGSTTLAGADSADSLTLDAGGAVAFGASSTDSTSVTNGLIVQGVNGSGATGGAVSQAGTLSVGGRASIDAGTNDITLSNAANTLSGPVTLTGGAVTLANTNSTTLAGENDAGGLTLDAGGAVIFGAAGTDSTSVTNGLIVQGVNGSGAAGGAVSQAGTLTVGGTTSIDAGTNDVTLSNSSNALSGPVTLTGGAVTLANIGTTTLTGTSSASSLTLDAGGAVAFGAASADSTSVTNGLIVQGINGSGAAGGAVSQAGTLTVGGTMSIDAGTNDVTLSNSGNALSGPVTLTGGAVTLANTGATTLAGTGSASSLTLDAGGPVTFGTTGTDSTTVANNLVVQGVNGGGAAGGAVGQVGTLSVGGTMSIDAGTNDVTLSNSGNALSGPVTLTGGAVTLANTGATTLAGTGSASSLTLDAGGPVTFGTTGTDSTTVANDLVVEGVNGNGAAGGAVSQLGTLSVEGTTSIDAGTNAITLSNPVDSFAGPVTLAGGAVTLANAGATTLAGASSAGSLTLDAGGPVTFGTVDTDSTTVANDLVVQGVNGSGAAAGGAVGQLGTLSVGGTTSIDAGTNAITLSNSADSLSGPVTLIGGAVTLADTSTTTLAGASSVGSLTLDAGGEVNFGTVDSDSTTVANDLAIQGVSGSGSTGGAVSQAGTLTVGGTTSIDAGTNAITLSNPADSFSGPFTLSGGAVTLANTDPTTFSGSNNASSLTLDAGGAVSFGTASTDNTTVANDLVVQGLNGSGAAGGAVTQIDALSVGGATSIDAGTNAIILTDPADTFAGPITLTGGAVTLANAGATTLAGASSATSLTLDAGGAVTFGTAATDSTTVTNDLVMQGVNGSGAAGGAVSQVGTLSVGGTTAIDAGTYNITLSNPADAFQGPVTLTGGVVTLANTDPTTLAGANSADSLILFAAGPVTFGTADSDSTTLTNALVIQGVSGSGAAGGAVSQVGTLSVGGPATIDAGTSDITLSNPANAFAGPVVLTGGAVTLANLDGTTLGGMDKVDSLTLDAGGAVTFGTATTDSMTVANDLVIQGVNGSGAAGGAVGQVGKLSVGGTTSIDAGTNGVTLSNPGNLFSGPVTLMGGAATLANTGATTLAGSNSASSLTLDAGGAVTFGAAITDSTSVTNGLIVQGVNGSGAAGGAVSQGGLLSVGGTTSIDAGTNDITLDQANNFGGNVTFTGRDVALMAGAGSLTSSGTASGTLTEIAQGASSNLNVGTLKAGGDVLLIAGNSILGTGSQATLTANDVELRYGLENASGQLGGATAGQQLGLTAASGSQVTLTVWAPQGSSSATTGLRQGTSNFQVTQNDFPAGQKLLVAALYSAPFGTSKASIEEQAAGGLSIDTTSSFQASQTLSSELADASTGLGKTVLHIDWASYNPNVSLFGTLNPAVCLPADQREDDTGSGTNSRCSVATASLLRAPLPILLAMVPTREGWKSMPLFNLMQ